MEGYCDICGTTIDIQMCCSGDQCGCMGMPTEPPVCGQECWEKYLEQKLANKKNK